MTDTANLGLPCIEGNQAQKHVTHNEALRLLDTLVQLAVLDRDLTAPPASPAEGESWIVKTGATGAWAGHVDAVASWQDGVWQFSVPRVGWLAYVVDESALLAWDGSAWVSAIVALTPTALNDMTLLGVGTTADATNPFSAKLNNVLLTARTLAESGDGDVRAKLNKEAAGNTASLLFQDNYSGRAEIGLTGDDDFRVKVSPDGSTWRDAIVIDRSTGQVSFPQGGASADLELTLAELSLGVADALNTAQFLGSSGNRFADSFDTLTYVDTGAASNLDSATAGLLKPLATSGASPSYANAGATGNRTATIVVTVAGISVDGGLASNMVNGSTSLDTSGSWYTNTSVAAAGATMRFDFGAGVSKVITEAKWYQNSASVSHGIWKWQGSNDASSWTDIGASFTLGGATVQTQTALSANVTGYRYYQLLGVSGTFSNATFNEEIEFKIDNYAVPTTGNLTVASNALTAAAAPASAKLVARVKEVDTIALNSDLIFSVSRDGGATFSAFTMSKRYTASSVAVYESNALDLSAQPSGTSMKWKVVSANNKMFEINDIYLYWS
ncbi:MAG: DUF2793 domain-containing protein [Rhodopseudomonas sp.]|nr:DUF2793 domain-containing protein [Rhodopseudomonas sp.]